MRLKKIFFYICMLSASYLSMEAVSFLVYSSLHGQWFSFALIEDQRKHAIDSLSDVKDMDLDLNIIVRHPEYDTHPFLGFVRKYDGIKRTVPFVTAYGFFAEADPIIASKDPHNAIIAITGGSVAEDFYLSSVSTLRQQLEKLPAFHNKNLVFIMLGTRSYKQPQQLLSVAYYLVQGGRLDMLINLDGRNDANSATYAVERDQYPLYPNSRLANNINLPVIINMGKAAMFRDMRRKTALFSSPTKFSVTACTLWSLLDHYLERQSVGYEESAGISAKQNKDRFYGPTVFSTSTSDEITQFVADAWERSSLQLFNLSKANHFYYFHFLQPNQYIPESKPLSDVEKSQFYLDTPENRRLAYIYAEFGKRIDTLQGQGVSAYSLVELYKHIPETIYVDSCCHVNHLGNEMIANKIGDDISAYVKSNPATH